MDLEPAHEANKVEVRMAARTGGARVGDLVEADDAAVEGTLVVSRGGDFGEGRLEYLRLDVGVLRSGFHGTVGGMKYAVSGRTVDVEGRKGLTRFVRHGTFASHSGGRWRGVRWGSVRYKYPSLATTAGGYLPLQHA